MVNVIKKGKFFIYKYENKKERDNVIYEKENDIKFLPFFSLLSFLFKAKKIVNLTMLKERQKIDTYNLMEY